MAMREEMWHLDNGERGIEQQCLPGVIKVIAKNLSLD
jgi:hypothetical protein